MSIPCLIEIDGITYTPRKPYVFAALPRVGEAISLEWEDGSYPEYVVWKIRHVPDDVQDLPAFTVLFVRKA